MREVQQAIRILSQKVEQIQLAIQALTHLDDFQDQPAQRKSKRTVSPAARRKMALAQRARWQQVKAGKAAGKTAKKSGISPAGRARIAAAARARWARVKAAQRKPKLVKKAA